MSSQKVIIIMPGSQQTLDMDMKKLSVLIKSICKTAGEKLKAVFNSEIIDDVATLWSENAKPVCDHKFGMVDIEDAREDIINLYLNKELPENIAVKCIKCKKIFKIFGNQFELERERISTGNVHVHT